MTRAHNLTEVIIEKQCGDSPTAFHPQVSSDVTDELMVPDVEPSMRVMAGHKQNFYAL
jgi:hypothetical protein